MKMRYVEPHERKPKMATQFPKPITDEQWEKIAHMLKIGGDIEDAAGYAGVSYGRLRRNLEGDRHLRREVKHFFADCKRHHLQRVYDGVRGWQSSAWFLERCYRKQFSLQQQFDTEEEKAIQVRKIVRRSGPIPSVEEIADPIPSLN